ncbi:MAG: DUF2268 domain-containing putative Zn-dependent protease [Acidimicrobiia bacterium]
MTGRAQPANIVFLIAEHDNFDAGEIAQIRDAIGATVTSCYAALASLSPTLNITVFPGDYPGAGIITDYGVGGFAANANWMRIAIDRSGAPSFDRIVNEFLPATVLHEVHHCARIRAFGAPETAQDAAISEGLATAFERDMLGSQPPWGDYSAIPADAWADEILALENPYAHRDWFFTHPDGRRWIGYRAGTYLVDCAMKSSGKSAAQLADVPTKTILADANAAQA